MHTYIHIYIYIYNHSSLQWIDIYASIHLHFIIMHPHLNLFCILSILDGLSKTSTIISIENTQRVILITNEVYVVIIVVVVMVTYTDGVITKLFQIVGPAPYKYKVFVHLFDLLLLLFFSLFFFCFHFCKVINVIIIM